MQLSRSISAQMLATVAAFLLIGCHRSNSPNTPQTDTRERELPPIEEFAAPLTLTDTAGNPIANATVMIGPEENKPFEGNLLRSNANGEIIAPGSWTDEQPVTIDAAGFVRATYNEVSPGATALMLRRPPPNKPVEVSGITTGFDNLKKDGFLDVGLIMTTSTPGQLAQFNMSSFLSPERDVIDNLPAGKTVEVPSNMSIPKQKESYLFFTFTMDKPKYRMFLFPPFDYRLIAMHVRFPVKPMVEKGKKNVFELVNQFEFKSMGYRDVSTTRNTTDQDIAVNTTIFVPTTEVKAPKYSSDKVMLAVSLVPMGKQFFPSDLKRIPSGTSMTLRYPQDLQTPGSVLAVLRSADAEGRVNSAKAEIFTSALVPADQAKNIEFLPLISSLRPSVGRLKLRSKRNFTLIEARGTHAILSNVEIIPTSESPIEIKTPRWDVYSKRWNKDLKLPKFPTSVRMENQVQRWEVMFLGDNRGKPATEIGPLTVETVTHVSKTAVDL